MKSEEERDLKVSGPRKSSSPLSSPDSESSFVDEKEKIQHKVESSLENSSEESTASSLKRRLRNLPSPSESSPFREGSVLSSRLFRKERDFFYHLQELSNSIEEKDEAEVSSASSETRISSVIGSKLQNPRARRRAKMMEAVQNQNCFGSKMSTDTDRDSVSKNSRGSSLKTMIPKIENQEDSEFSQNSSRYGDSSGRRFGSNNIDNHESENSSSRSNLPSGERKKRFLYRNDLKPQNDVMTSPLSPSSPLNFPGTFPILSNQKISKKVGGYRSASVLLCNLSSESESETGNDKILQNFMIERIKARDELLKIQSRVFIQTNPQSLLESNSSSTKCKERNFLLRKESCLNSAENSACTSETETKIVGDFEEIIEKKLEKTILARDPASTLSTPRRFNTEFNKSLISNPTSTRSDPSGIDRSASRIPSFLYSRSNKPLEENSPHLTKSAISSGRPEINLKKENSLRDNKLKVPTLKIRSQDLSPSIGSKDKENQQTLDMKALITALSDVSLKHENAFGDSGKSRSDNSGNRQIPISSRSSCSKAQLSSNSRSPALQKIPTRIAERISARSSQSEKNIEFESINDFSQRMISSTEKKSALSTPKKIEKTRNDFFYEKHLPEISRFGKTLSSKNLGHNETLSNILTSRTEYSEVKSPCDRRSVRCFDLTSLDFKTTKNEDCLYDLKKEESTDFEETPKVVHQAEMFPIENFSPSFHEKSEDEENKFQETLSVVSSSKASSTENHQQEKNDFDIEIISFITKTSTSFKLDPITVLKTSEQCLSSSPFKTSESLTPKSSDNPNAFILPKQMKENLVKDSNKLEENVAHRNLERLFPKLTKEKVVQTQSAEESQNQECQQTQVQNQSDKEAISDDSLTNNRMFESCMGDSNLQAQRRWGYRREIIEKYSRELTELHYQEPKLTDFSTNNKFNPESGNFNLIESSASFNSMKLAKSDSTAILSKKSTDHPNFPTKSSSSMSKLTCLLDSMKKETQDRFPFTISESTSRNSTKFKIENEQDRAKETLSEFEEQEEISYKLDIHPSITRLALSGTELLPSELISCVSYENPSHTRKFLPRMRNYVRRFSTSFRKKRTKTSKSDSPKILFKNSDCRLESVGSSGDTMELQFLGEEIEDAKVPLNSKSPKENPRSVPNFLEMSNKRDRNDIWIQRCDSETESGQLTEVKSSRIKSSPVAIKTKRAGFSELEEPEPKELQDLLLEKKSKEVPEKVKQSSEKEVPSVDAIKVNVREQPSQNAVESSCFCFQLCRAIAQPTVGSPGSVYLSSKSSKPHSSNRKNS